MVERDRERAESLSESALREKFNLFIKKQIIRDLLQNLLRVVGLCVVISKFNLSNNFREYYVKFYNIIILLQYNFYNIIL